MEKFFNGQKGLTVKKISKFEHIKLIAFIYKNITCETKQLNKVKKVTNFKKILAVYTMNKSFKLI